MLHLKAARCQLPLLEFAVALPQIEHRGGAAYREEAAQIHPGHRSTTAMSSATTREIERGVVTLLDIVIFVVVIAIATTLVQIRVILFDVVVVVLGLAVQRKHAQETLRSFFVIGLLKRQHA